MGCSRVGVSIFTPVPMVPVTQLALGTQLALSRGLLDEQCLVQSNVILLVMIYFLERSYLRGYSSSSFFFFNVFLIGHDEHGMWDLSSPNRVRTCIPCTGSVKS